MNRIKVALISVIAVLGVLAVIATLRGPDIFREDTLTRVRRDGVIRIGYAVEAPYAFINESGEVTGESPEIAKLVVTRLGIARINWRLIRFEELLQELEAGNIDVIAAGMCVTPERSRRASFSRPTSRVRQALLVAAGNPLRLHSYRALVDHPTARAALLMGSVEAPLVRLLGMPAVRRVAVPDSRTGRVAVESGLADGLALSSPTIRWMVATAQSGKTEIAEPFEQVALAGAPAPAEEAFAFRRSDEGLRAAWDGVLRSYLGTTEHRALVAKFGFTADELPVLPESP